MSLIQLGFSDFFKSQMTPEDAGLEVARVIQEQKSLYRIVTAHDSDVSEDWAEIPGKWHHTAQGRNDLPAVGDFVLLHPKDAHNRRRIARLLDRKTKLSRQSAGGTVAEQIIAANVDKVCLVASLNQNLNLRRLERMITLAWNSGAEPVLVLTKSDLAANRDELIESVCSISQGASLHVTSTISGEGLEEFVAKVATQGQTLVLFGSSGVGKSSLVNALIGTDRQEVKTIRAADDKGQHTTTTRDLIRLPTGALIIDTPGVREIQLWSLDEASSASDAADATFADVTQLAATCRFTDCQHDTEPDCAINRAIADGSLAPARLASYEKLQRELQFQARRQSKSLMRAAKQEWKKRGAEGRTRMRMKRDSG